ncbi:hypothetical protein HMPREF0971_00405 [Segatella oris F0302]|uniref:Uncharacterized protein n=1 Tax=Segatella oris F0302 TaxID=649760 RepID=D1QN69_9BACT|nr:hypothetical protein HMPREF0971_00405 [Segatella oris F0302]
MQQQKSWTTLKNFPDDFFSAHKRFLKINTNFVNVIIHLKNKAHD